MNQPRPPLPGVPRTARIAIAGTRIALGACVIGLLIYLYFTGISLGNVSLVDYFGYFTNLTSLLTAAVLIATGVRELAGRPAPDWLTSARAVAVSCMIVVALIYNTLVPGTGSAPPWASTILHAVFPALVLLDSTFVGDRPPIAWKRLWIVLCYPLLWLGVVLLRGATDDWVPYGFLLPERGLLSLAVHIIGMLFVLLVAASLVWALSRSRGVCVRSNEVTPAAADATHRCDPAAD